MKSSHTFNYNLSGIYYDENSIVKGNQNLSIDTKVNCKIEIDNDTENDYTDWGGVFVTSDDKNIESCGDSISETIQIDLNRHVN